MAEKKTDQRQALPMELDVKIYRLREDGSTLARRRRLRLLGSALRSGPKPLRCSSSSRQTRFAGLCREGRHGGTGDEGQLRPFWAARRVPRNDFREFISRKSIESEGTPRNPKISWGAISPAGRKNPGASDGSANGYVRSLL